MMPVNTKTWPDMSEFSRLFLSPVFPSVCLSPAPCLALCTLACQHQTSLLVFKAAHVALLMLYHDVLTMLWES